MLYGGYVHNDIPYACHAYSLLYGSVYPSISLYRHVHVHIHIQVQTKYTVRIHINTDTNTNTTGILQ